MYPHMSRFNPKLVVLNLDSAWLHSAIQSWGSICVVMRHVSCFFFHFSRNKLLKPAMRDLVMTVAAMVQTTAATPMLALTHGQPATPTTLGKELANFAYVGFEL